MSLAAFSWTNRVRPVIELGLGDSRVPVSSSVWDTAKWDDAAAKWAGDEPTWVDVSCDVRTVRLEYGRRSTTDRFVPGLASVVVDNSSGWADPNAILDPNVLAMRPGRAIRIGFVHATLGTVWRFRGFVDAVRPTYAPTETDTVELECVDALGEVNRAKLKPLAAPVGDGEWTSDRLHRIFDASSWSALKRAIDGSPVALVATDLGGQVADLLGRTAESAGGSMFGDYSGNLVFRHIDWQTYTPGSPPDATIGNVAAGDVCPSGWERPYARADIATRVLVGRDAETAVVRDDATGQIIYGIEPFERTDLLTLDDATLGRLADRILATRNYTTAPRVRSVLLDARTADDALDLMTAVDVYRPSRYRCRLAYPRGDVFDAEHFATGVVHEITPGAWTLSLSLDLAAPYAAAGGKWDEATWDTATWGAATVAELDDLVAEARSILSEVPT